MRTNIDYNAIDAILNSEDPKQSIGAYVLYLQRRLLRLLENDEEGRPLLNHATSEECSTLFQLTAAIESTIALNKAAIRKQDAIAKEKAKED